jgi:hypothetical protein
MYEILRKILKHQKLKILKTYQPKPTKSKKEIFWIFFQFFFKFFLSRNIQDLNMRFRKMTKKACLLKIWLFFEKFQENFRVFQIFCFSEFKKLHNLSIQFCERIISRLFKILAY